MTILNKLPKWFPAFVMMSAIFTFSSIPSSGIPSFDWADVIVKKGGHMIGYALLTLAYLRAFDNDINKWKLIWLLAILYASSDELHQSFVPGRSASVIDVGIDSIGAGLGLLWVRKTN